MKEIPKLYPTYYTRLAKLERGLSVEEHVQQMLKRTLPMAMGYERATGIRDRLADRILNIVPTSREMLRANVMDLRGPARGRLLDVGCGRGDLLKTLRELGWDTLGVEADEQAVRYAQTALGLRVLEAVAEDMDFPRDSFDAITMNHSIEHFHDPRKVLSLCARFLRPGGVLSIRTPNFTSWGHALYRESWMHLDPPRHLQLFSADTLQRCIEEVGLVVVKWRTSAVGAGGVLTASRGVRRDGFVDLLQHPPPPTLTSQAFRLVENAVTLVRKDAGEELVFLAAKTG